VRRAERGDLVAIAFRLNQRAIRISVAPRCHLADMLREQLLLTGTHLSCEHGVCGACNVMVNGVVVRACLMLAVQVDGAEVLTIEGLTAEGRIADLQKAFVARNALQCGFCTPGMLMTAHELLARQPAPSREEIRIALSGNYCRCTGYHAIVDAIETVASQRRGAALG
jgi:aerobic-type carbon monoxide dehydrogenase small subunit (CoxS/CutS family)